MTDHVMGEFMPSDPIMAAAWVGAMHYALGNEQILQDFRTATGNTWKPARSGLDRMIDEATGADRHFIEAFAAWFNENIWGPL